MKNELDIPAFLRKPKGYKPDPKYYNLNPKPVKEVKKEKIEPDKIKVNIQDRVQFRAQKLYLKLDEIFESECWLGDEPESNSVFDYLVNSEVPGMIVSKAIPIVKERVLEYTNIDQFGMSNKERKKFGAWWDVTYQTCERYLENVGKAKVRKPRKRKAKSPEKQLAAFKYCAQHNPMQLASVNPIKVLGAIQVWLFDYKALRLTMINAMDRGGIDVKGLTLLNIDERSSVTKRVGRKTQKVINDILNKSKPQCKKVLADVTAKPSRLQTRSNNTTLILRVF